MSWGEALNLFGLHFLSGGVAGFFYARWVIERRRTSEAQAEADRWHAAYLRTLGFDVERLER